MDRPIAERRQEPRVPAGALRLTHATLRPGHALHVLDLSPHGAQVETTRPLRPGSRVHLRLVLGDRRIALAAHVLRCAVSALDADRGVVYRGALSFDERCVPVRDAAAGEGLPGPPPAAGLFE